MRFVNFGSIEKFEVILKNVKHDASYVGVDENGVVIREKFPKLPVVVGVASEKVHGTNASICITQDEFWVQKRTDIITPENDNAGCAFASYTNKEAWIRLAKELANEYDIDLNRYIVSVFYEWCGGNIQDNSAVSNLDKRAIIFQYFKVSPIVPVLNKNGEETKESSIWLETKTRAFKKPDCAFEWVEDSEHKIFNIMNFPHYSFEIDFANPNEAIEAMNKTVLEVIEPNSPLGQGFGVEGNIGEGMVVTFVYKNCVHRFKVKGEKHSKSKVRTLKSIDNSKDAAKIECANKITTALRLEQAMQTVFGIANEKKEPCREDIGAFIKAVHADIVKEELDTIASYGLELKQVSGFVSKICVTWFDEELMRLAAL